MTGTPRVVLCAGDAPALIEASGGASSVAVGRSGQGGFTGRLSGTVVQQVLRNGGFPAVVVCSPEGANH